MNAGTQTIQQSGFADLPGILSKEQQRKAFRAAKRHTLAIKLFRFLMPALALGIVGLYLIPFGARVLTKDLPVSISSINLDSKGLKMINPRYSGSNEKIGSYSVEAEYALQQITATHLLELHKISGIMQSTDNKWTKLTANKGIYNTKSENMNLQEDILITSSQGMTAKMQSADINMKKQVVVTDKSVELRKDKSTIRADSMTLSIAQKSVLFRGNVKVRLYRNGQKAP